MPRTVVVQVRMTEQEAAQMQAYGKRMSRAWSGLLRPDGSVNLSAAVRHRLFRSAP